MGSCTDTIGRQTDIVDCLEDMADGWLCAGLPDAELPKEAAAEIRALRTLLHAVRDNRDELAAGYYSLSKDAARYQWLRSGRALSFEQLRGILNDTPHGIDRAVDAAMGAAVG